MNVIHLTVAIAMMYSATQITQPREPIAQYLMRRGASKARATAVSKQIRAAAKRHDVDPALLTAIVTTENPLLKSTARSRAGATGLMQIMPLWRREYSASCGTKLTDDRTNLCVGIKIYQQNLAKRKSLVGALLAYNGCRSRTAKCGRYATIVLRHRAAVAKLITDTAGTG